ncbi:pollen receptor-like kinase 2 [Impatiens glandulifera]|uniref:pollen receptor-like kinase 2 n=1 Tax=Impatiens glandulifera TaxID=253017 RepID=UPI001FB0B2AA|nr:pollen receptor-like kinase 2 [Impatiens glandulifera]
MVVQPNPILPIIITILTHLAVVIIVAGADAPSPDAISLIKFKNSMTHTDVLFSWNATKPPCTGKKSNWVGILCNEDQHVIGIRLEGMKLSGAIDVDSLKNIPTLRSLSLMDNNFEGKLPNLGCLGTMKTIYLSNNKFSGEIDSVTFERMRSLKKLYLGNNGFTGLIPLSLITLPRLVELSLEGNKFCGEIPPFMNTRFRFLNVSSNKLEGVIPRSLSKIDATSFYGNPDLCGAPLINSCKSSKLPLLNTILFIITLIAALASIGAVFIILRKKRKTTQTRAFDAHYCASKGGREIFFPDNFVTPYYTSSIQILERFETDNLLGKLVFAKEDHEKFELPDLLKSSAEVLGTGYFGASFKAGLPSGKNMFVKKFKHMNNVGREDFQEHIIRLGRLSHSNLLPPVAFYYRKEEKLLVSDYINNVSLAVYLHGNRSLDEPSLNWPTRLNIIKGVANGLQHLYNEFPNLVVPHGHLKSSNVLLSETMEPLLTDYSLVTMVNVEHAQQVMIAYKSPEYKHQHRVSKKTDVWSLGILIIEILTGKIPSNHFQQHGNGIESDLVAWVQSKDQEDFSEIFDENMGVVGKDDKKEMVKLLKIGLACAESDMNKRYDIMEAVKKIEALKSKNL